VDIRSEASKAGIQSDYHDVHGRRHIVSDDTLRRVLEALPQAEHTSAPYVRRSHDNRPLPLPSIRGARWQLRNQNGVVETGTVENERVVLPEDMPVGLYDLDVIGGDDQVSSRLLLAAPAEAYSGDFDRVWVLSIQLYSLVSDRNWGIGDFSDLKDLLQLCASIGCAGVGLNPLHVLFEEHPNDCSPYAPNSRLFLNPLYIDVLAVPEFDHDWIEDLRREIAEEKSKDLIDYWNVARWKLASLWRAFRNFQNDGSSVRRQAFEDFRRDRGELLRRFAYFEVMRKQFRMPWWEWPERVRNPSEQDIDAQRAGLAGQQMEFIEYVQWNAHIQLQECSTLAKQLGLKVGLYLDIAVGVRADGFDAWSERHVFARQISVGAPPDLLNTMGQDWGVVGFNPTGLLKRRLEPLRAMVRSSMRYAGAIRLDHVMGLQRLYVIPAGLSPVEGAYLSMPLDASLAVIAQESQIARCIVVGEDLGTVPEGFREHLREWGIWSYQVMLFEREHDGRFKQASSYTPNAVVTFNTHDLPSFAGWRSFHDLRVKLALGQDPGETEEQRYQAVAALEQRLIESSIGRQDFMGVVKFLSTTPCRILSVSLDDLLGVVDQINVPGTVDSHPNWRRRLPQSADYAERLKALATTRV